MASDLWDILYIRTGPTTLNVAQVSRSRKAINGWAVLEAIALEKEVSCSTTMWDARGSVRVGMNYTYSVRMNLFLREGCCNSKAKDCYFSDLTACLPICEDVLCIAFHHPNLIPKLRLSIFYARVVQLFSSLVPRIVFLLDPRAKKPLLTRFLTTNSQFSLSLTVLIQK
jgi:hypothetical protein